MREGNPLEFYSEPLPGVDSAELLGRLIVVEGADAVGRTTQVERLKSWLEQQGHAVLHTGMARSALAGKGIQQAKEGNTFGPITMTLYYVTDFADRLENEIIPALRAGFVVLTDRYIFSMIARAIARDEDRTWIEQVSSFALVPHAVYYLKTDVRQLVTRVVVGRGAFDYWESGMDVRFGEDMYESFVRYQTRIIRALDSMSRKYSFEVIDAGKSADAVFAELQRRISRLLRRTGIRPPARARRPKLRRAASSAA
ncbi:MAG: thymidylate kinase [Acidobacteria bacterium]|nr:thymidylate kinase [Acidobacteriota bacterium]MBI3278349.1 thymidylate kinase [Acidobacteriota bacterium]